MNYVIKDVDNKTVATGANVADLEEADLPAHGSVSIELSGGRWLNFLTSEWLIVKITTQPEGWSGK